MTAEVKEQIGYEVPEGMRNPDLQRKALKHRRQIYSVAQPYIEGVLGRPVEMGAIFAGYPYPAANVHFRTLDEPYVADYLFVVLEEDGSVHRDSYIEPYAESRVVLQTANGLLDMAYRPETTAIEDYLRAGFPELCAQLPVRAKTYGGTGALAGISLDMGDHTTYDARSAVESELYQAYRANPQGTDQDWRAILDRRDPSVTLRIGIGLRATDPVYEFDVADVRKIVDRIRAELPVQGFTSWSIGVSSNLVTRDGGDSHHYVSIEWGTGMNGRIVNERVDGGNVR